VPLRPAGLPACVDAPGFSSHRVSGRGAYRIHRYRKNEPPPRPAFQRGGAGFARRAPAVATLRYGARRSDPMTSILPELAPELMVVLERHADRLDVDLIDRALRFSASAHRGQKRMSG